VEGTGSSGAPLSSNGQIELGSVTLRQLGKHVGDTVLVGVRPYRQRLRITGTVPAAWGSATGDLPAGVRHTIGQLTDALTTAVPADRHGPAGSLDWSVQRTVDHLVDVCCWYAIQPKLTASLVGKAQRMYDTRQFTMAEIATSWGVTPMTIYRHIRTDKAPRSLTVGPTHLDQDR